MQAQVGFREGRSEDKARPSWDGDGPRPLSWAAWYPTSGGVEQEMFGGPPSAPWFTIGPAVRDAALHEATRHYPVVLLSHGTGGLARGLGWLARRLAQRGLIAIGVNHHGNTAVEPYRAEGFLCLWERARDLTVLLDAMNAQGEFAGRLDMDRVFVGGFSAGACTAAALLGAITVSSRFDPSEGNLEHLRGPREFPDLPGRVPGLFKSSQVLRDSWARMANSYRDGRIKAALLCAPGRSILRFSEESLTRIEAPVRIAVGGSDGIAPAEECARWLHERLRASTLEILPGAGHYVFVPEALEAGRRAEPDVWSDAPFVDRRAIHDRVAASAAELFEDVA